MVAFATKIPRISSPGIIDSILVNLPDSLKRRREGRKSVSSMVADWRIAVC